MISSTVTPIKTLQVRSAEKPSSPDHAIIRFFWLFSTVLILCSFTFAQGQRTAGERNRREASQHEKLKKLMSRVGVDVSEIDDKIIQPQTYRELKIRWVDATKPSTELRPASNPEEQTQPADVSIVEDRIRSGTLPRHRSLELSPTHLFIAAVDATNKLQWWSIIPDPRVVRAETQTPTGELRSENYYVSNVTLLVAFPDDPEITNLRFYLPVWNGTDFELKSLAVVPTP